MCLEPAEGSVKIQQRCAGGLLAPRMMEKDRYYNRGPTGIRTSTEAFSSGQQQDTASEAPNSDSGSDSGDERSEPEQGAAAMDPAESVDHYAAVAVRLYKEGIAKQDATKLQQAVQAIVQHRCVPVIRRYVNAATLTQE